VDLGFLAKPNSAQYRIPGCTPVPISTDSGYWQIAVDTVFKNQTYKHMYGNGLLVGIIREDTLARKVFFHPNCDTSAEFLLYDFSLQVGDTISYAFPNSTAGYIDSGVYTVDSILYRYNYGTHYSDHFFLTNHNSPGGKTLEIAEGVGCLNHPLFLWYWFGDGVLYPWAQPLAGPPLFFSKLVSCKWDEGNKMYGDTVAYYLADSGQKQVTITIHDSCDYTSICCSVGTTFYSASTSLKAFPNPASDIITVGLPDAEAPIILTDLLGNEYQYEIRARDLKKAILDISALPPGTYLLRVGKLRDVAHALIYVQH